MKKLALVLGKRLLLSMLVAGGILWAAMGSAQDTQEQEMAPTIVSSASVGEVSFPHQFHFEDLELECQACHHETNASTLQMPHEGYFEDFWIDCRICHRSDSSPVSQPQACSNCHHASPTDIADETLSAKVVIHKNCWECHELEKGEAASRSCATCHQKKKEKREQDQTAADLNEGSLQ